MNLSKLSVNIKRLSEYAVIPQYAKANDAGFDLVATEDIIVEPGATVKVPTGLAFELPEGYELQVRPRSGVTLKTKLRVQFGTVDTGYRAEVGVIVDNISIYADLLEIPTMDGEYVILSIDGKYHHCSEKIHEGGSYIIRKGDRIAQGVIKPVEQVAFTEVDELNATDRGAGGFGSTGIK